MPNTVSTTYTRTQPFAGRLKARYRLTGPESRKRTEHLVLDLSDSGIAYQPGDSVGVLPQNGPTVVDRTLTAMQSTGDELITDKRKEDTLSLRRFLTERANLSTVPRSLAQKVAQAAPGGPLDTLVEDRTALKSYLGERHLWDFLMEYPQVKIDPAEVCHSLQPLIPRLYSIASSQQVVGDEVHLTVAYVEYETNGHKRHGVATHWLCDELTIDSEKVPLYIQPANKFSLPDNDETPIIMIGPGTGVAPFRSFMQERTAAGATGPAWLFFGEWTRQSEFFYEAEWMALVEAGALRVATAFSRDQTEKVYVQDRLREYGEEVYRWIEQGAHLYLCGDAARMAKDVETTLIAIIAQYGNSSEEAAREHLKALRKAGRYMKDVY